MKKCSKCKKEKSKTEFFKRSKAIDGLQAYCKDCKKTIRKTYYEEVECSETKVEERRIRQRTAHYKAIKFVYSKSKGYFKIKASKSKRRKLIMDNNDSTITATTLEILKAAQSNKCYYCNSLLLFDHSTHLDHYIPLSKGGMHSITNVVWSCSTCNLIKHDKLLDLPLSKAHIEQLSRLLSETSLN